VGTETHLYSHYWRGGGTAEITIALDDADCVVDRQNNQIRKHRDKVFDDQCAAYDANPADENGDKRIGP